MFVILNGVGRSEESRSPVRSVEVLASVGLHSG